MASYQVMTLNNGYLSHTYGVEDDIQCIALLSTFIVVCLPIVYTYLYISTYIIQFYNYTPISYKMTFDARIEN